MTENSIRCFLGMALADEDAVKISQALARVHTDTMPGLRLVPPRNWHLTLTFLGNQSLEWLDALRQALTLASSNNQRHARISLNSRNIGGFPDAKGRILALTLNTESLLATLKANVDTVLRQWGFTPESRVYLPHITLGRFERNQVAHSEPVPCADTVTFSRLTLFRSVPSAQGSEYQPLWSLPFGGLLNMQHSTTDFSNT